MGDIPVWIATTQALAAPIIAIGVGIIAFMQWRTAHQKVLLDLFERRVKVYDKVNDAVVQYLVVPTNVKNLHAINKLSQAWSESRSLFGQSVSDAIHNLRDQIWAHSQRERRLQETHLGEADRERIVAELKQMTRDLHGWRDPFTDVCLPYLRMDQKRVRTPVEWFHDQNRKRLSYGEPPTAAGREVQAQEEPRQQEPAEG